MRTELLVIVAVIFLCSWCIYILVKMNGSVASSTQVLRQRQHHQQSSNNKTSNDKLSNHSYDVMSKSSLHTIHSNPPYRMRTNISDIQKSSGQYPTANTSPTDIIHRPFLQQKANTSNLDYDYDDYSSRNRNNNDQRSVNANLQLLNHQKNNNRQQHMLTLKPPLKNKAIGSPNLTVQMRPVTNNLDIDVTRPKYSHFYHSFPPPPLPPYNQANPFANDHHHQFSQLPISTANNGLRSVPLETPMVDAEYVGSQSSASNNIGRLDNNSGRSNGTSGASGADDESGSGEPDDDQGIELDERSGSTSYNELEDEAHEDGRSNQDPQASSHSESQSNDDTKNDETTSEQDSDSDSAVNNGNNSSDDNSPTDNLAQSTKATVDTVHPTFGVSDSSDDYYEDYPDTSPSGEASDSNKQQLKVQESKIGNTEDGEQEDDKATNGKISKGKVTRSPGKDRNSHEHKIKESVVTQQWNDGDDTEDVPRGKNNLTTFYNQRNNKSNKRQGGSDDDDETIKFLDLDKTGEPFASKRFKRQTYDDTVDGDGSTTSYYSPANDEKGFGPTNISAPTTLGSRSQFDSTVGNRFPGEEKITSSLSYHGIDRNHDSLPYNETKQLESRHDPSPYSVAPFRGGSTDRRGGFKVEIPNFFVSPQSPDQAIGISASVDPYQTTQISLLPGSNGHQPPFEESQEDPWQEATRKRRLYQNSRPYPMELVPVKNHQTGIQPEYIVIEKDRQSEPSHHYKKKKSEKKKKGHKSKKKNYKSKHVKMHKKQKKKMSKSYKKGEEKKKKHKAFEDKFKKEKGFKGFKKGKKSHKGHGSKGGKKGVKFYKDKGYKKKGFKNTYHKEEFGDRKTYFDEFRDKDYKKKWKKFEDKHKYNQVKEWAGKDIKKMKKLTDRSQKHKISGKAKWKKKHSSKQKKSDIKHGHGSKKKSYSKKL